MCEDMRTSLTKKRLTENKVKGWQALRDGDTSSLKFSLKHNNVDICFDCNDRLFM